MKIFFIGGQTAGLIGKLTVLAKGHTLVHKVEDSDILLCVHGRKIIPKEIFEKPKIAAINVHPYLYVYKGADPIGRAIADKNWDASVGCHHMIEEVDAGELIEELFIRVTPSDNRCEIYNQLYPVYCQVIIDSLRIVKEQYDS